MRSPTNGPKNGEPAMSDGSFNIKHNISTIKGWLSCGPVHSLSSPSSPSRLRRASAIVVASLPYLVVNLLKLKHRPRPKNTVIILQLRGGAGPLDPSTVMKTASVIGCIQGLVAQFAPIDTAIMYGHDEERWDALYLIAAYTHKLWLWCTSCLNMHSFHDILTCLRSNIWYDWN